MDIEFPFRIDTSGRTATAGRDRHVRDMIEQVLFTSPGERVNRPDFGSGLLQVIFAPLGSELAAALQFTTAGALQAWLSDVIDVESVDVLADEATLAVTVRYVVRRTGEQQVDTFPLSSSRSSTP